MYRRKTMSIPAANATSVSPTTSFVVGLQSGDFEGEGARVMNMVEKFYHGMVRGPRGKARRRRKDGDNTGQRFRRYPGVISSWVHQDKRYNENIESP